jgi:hypothetical protein
MKGKFKIFLILIFLIPVVKAQETTPACELFLKTENIPIGSPIMTFTLTAQSQCWGNLAIIPCPIPGVYFLTNDYDNPIYIPTANNLGSSSAGFDFVTSLNGFPTMAYGLYKVTSNGTDKHYYSCYNPPSIGNDIDIRIKYDFDFDTYSYSPTNDDYINISNGQLLNVWDVKGKGAGTQLTSLFPFYWNKCLAVLNDRNPRLVWGPNPYFENIVGYKIYRAVHSVPNPNPIVYSLIATVDDDVFDYKDDQLGIGPYDYIWYYVKAYNGQTESSRTNVVTTRAGFYKKNDFNEIISTKMTSYYKDVIS